VNDFNSVKIAWRPYPILIWSWFFCSQPESAFHAGRGNCLRSACVGRNRKMKKHRKQSEGWTWRTIQPSRILTSHRRTSASPVVPCRPLDIVQEDQRARRKSLQLQIKEKIAAVARNRNGERQHDLEIDPPRTTAIHHCCFIELSLGSGGKKLHHQENEKGINRQELRYHQGKVGIDPTPF